MKASTLATLVVACAARPATAVLFGPSHCVSLSQSSSSTCVLTTNCEGENLGMFDFAFDCEDARDGSVVRHSFGKGGFDASEEYDTEVVCGRCLPPEEDDDAEDSAPQARVPAAIAPTVQAASVPTISYAARLKQAKASQAKKEEAAASEEASADKKEEADDSEEAEADTVADRALRRAAQNGAGAAVATEVVASSQQDRKAAKPKSKTLNTVRYGPNGCVSTYKNKEGHCVIQTDCASADIKNYDFGLVCVDKVGAPVRHLFGLNSFDPQETFDTLITCSSCLGLEDIPDAVALNGEVLAMSTEMKEMKDMMQIMADNVKIAAR